MLMVGPYQLPSSCQANSLSASHQLLANIQQLRCHKEGLWGAGWVTVYYLLSCVQNSEGTEKFCFRWVSQMWGKPPICFQTQVTSLYNFMLWTVRGCRRGMVPLLQTISGVVTRETLGKQRPKEATVFTLVLSTLKAHWNQMIPPNRDQLLYSKLPAEMWV